MTPKAHSGEEFLSVDDAFAYYTECQLATVEKLAMSKRTPKGELARQRAIAEGMVNVVRVWRIRTRRNPRLEEALESKA